MTCVCAEVDPSDRPCLVCDVTALAALRTRVIEAARERAYAERAWGQIAGRVERLVFGARYSTEGASISDELWAQRGEAATRLTDAVRAFAAAVDALDAAEAKEKEGFCNE